MLRLAGTEVGRGIEEVSISKGLVLISGSIVAEGVACLEICDTRSVSGTGVDIRESIDVELGSMIVGAGTGGSCLTSSIPGAGCVRGTVDDVGG